MSTSQTDFDFTSTVLAQTSFVRIDWLTHIKKNVIAASTERRRLARSNPGKRDRGHKTEPALNALKLAWLLSSQLRTCYPFTGNRLLAFTLFNDDERVLRRAVHFLEETYGKRVHKQFKTFQFRIPFPKSAEEMDRDFVTLPASAVFCKDLSARDLYVLACQHARFKYRGARAETKRVLPAVGVRHRDKDRTWTTDLGRDAEKASIKALVKAGYVERRGRSALWLDDDGANASALIAKQRDALEKVWQAEQDEQAADRAPKLTLVPAEWKVA